MISRLFLLTLLVIPFAATAQGLLKISVADENMGKPIPNASISAIGYADTNLPDSAFVIVCDFGGEMVCGKILVQ